MGCSRCLVTTIAQSCVPHLTCKYLLRDIKMGFSVFYYFRMCKIPLHMNKNAQPLCPPLMHDDKSIIYNVLDDYDLQWLTWLKLVFCLSLSWSHSEFRTLKDVIYQGSLGITLIAWGIQSACPHQWGAMHLSFCHWKYFKFCSV